MPPHTDKEPRKSTVVAVGPQIEVTALKEGMVRIRFAMTQRVSMPTCATGFDSLRSYATIAVGGVKSPAGSGVFDSRLERRANEVTVGCWRLDHVDVGCTQLVRSSVHSNLERCSQS